MRVAHVVTYVSADGAFGGPVRVAVGQAEALARRGHDVTLFAAASITVPDDIEQDGYRLRLFPAKRTAGRRGFAGMRAQGLVGALKAQLPRIDVAHVHLARDLVTLPAVRTIRKSGTPYLVQPHGMIDPSTNPLAIPIDLWETRAALRGATAVLALTDDEEFSLTQVASGVRLTRVVNGVKMGNLPGYAGRDPVVLFLARLHERKRPLAFVEMAELLARDHPSLRFVLAGPDEGLGDAVNAAIDASGLGERLQWIGPVNPEATDALMTSAAVYVLPSVGEVFPMTVLEAWKAGTPTVVTQSLGIADSADRHGAALVAGISSAEIAAAVSRVLEDPLLQQRLREGGERYVRSELDIDDVAVQLEADYLAAQAGG